MKLNKVRVNALYVYIPVALDEYDPRSDAVYGQLVRVTNQHGVPKANIMGHCHIEDAGTGKFLGMVHVNSLRKREVS